MEWTRDKTLALISEYRKRRGLWDMTHDDYRKKEIKAKLLLEVSESLGGGIPVGEIEKKFHTLRTQYHRELSRYKREEPYNSKWFGFKNLQFLSSPKACRANKGRLKEITEEGTLTTKYVIRETSQAQEISGNVSVHSNQEEFISINPRKPTPAALVSYETLTVGNNLNTATSRSSHELEKLIEETTKDVDLEVIEDKPKRNENNYNNSSTNTLQTSGECADVDNMHVVDTKLSNNNEHVDATNANENPQTHHYIKIQRSESGDHDHTEDYYEEQDQSGPRIHTIVTGNGKRIYYDNLPNATQYIASTTAAKVHHQTIIKPALTRPQQQQPQTTTTTIAESVLSSPTPTPMSTAPIPRDEFSIYGEYISNEIRNIKNREILLDLKHKINTALYEASMAELKQ